MKKTVFWAVLGFLAVSVYVPAQTKPIMGYDKVAWGASVAEVRKVYSIGEEIPVKVSSTDSNIMQLIQENVSDSISERWFMFNNYNSSEHKLYRVTVEYKDSSDAAVETLKNLVASRYGKQTNTRIDTSSSGVSTIYIFGSYAPDLEVHIDHTTYFKGYKNVDVVYTWKKFRDEYQASKLGF